jgi:T-complex protein 1 subunit epsilon
MSLLIDEFGRPILLFDAENTKQRIKGVEAYKSNILAARGISSILRSSLGPKGMDKMLIDQDGNVTVTNDGATILQEMSVEHPVAKLLVELSQSQDKESGDGTTGVVVLAGALLEQAQKLLERGLHPLQIIEGFDKGCSHAVSHLNVIQNDLKYEENNEQLIKAAMTALCSKVVSKYQRKFAEICVDAVKAVADFQRKDVNFDMIKIEGKVGGSLEDTQLINGIVIDKEMSHPQMKKVIEDAKICILSAPFEAPKPKTKYNVDIKTAEDYKKLYEQEQQYYKDMVQKVKNSGANFVISQFGFEDEANYLLMQNDLPAVRWVGGSEIEQIAIGTAGYIVPRFQDIKDTKLGRARLVREQSFGTDNQKMIVIEDGLGNKVVTILVRGGSKMIVEEAKRCIHDALSVVRNMIRDPRVVCGGGASEISCSNYVNEKADLCTTIDQYSMRAFADALDQIPIALAENSGYNGIEYLANLKAEQKKTNNPYLGVDCSRVGSNFMSNQGVYEGYTAKRQQFQLATQVCKMILKIDDVIKPHDMDNI